MSGSLGLAATVRRSSGIVDAEIDGEVVALSIDRSDVFAMGAVGTRIWQLADPGIRVEDLCRVLTAEFKIGFEDCRDQVMSFLQELHGEGLVEIQPG